MLDAVAALREAVETVRAQIPKGELTVASVQRLLETAERVCQTQDAPPAPRSPRAQSGQSAKRLEERRKWARIAKEAEREARTGPSPAQ
ncbi:MAG: hypothetical protein AB7O95_09075 [Geminicoccaceae bacterium]